MPQACSGSREIAVAPADGPAAAGPVSVAFMMAAPLPGQLAVDAAGLSAGTVEAEWSVLFDKDEDGAMSQGDVIIALLHAHSGGPAASRNLASFDSQVRVVARVEPTPGGPARVAQRVVRRGLSVSAQGAQVVVTVSGALPPLAGLGPDTPVMASVIRRGAGAEVSFDALPRQSAEDVGDGRLRFARPQRGRVDGSVAGGAASPFTLTAVALSFGDAAAASPGDRPPGVVEE